MISRVLAGAHARSFLLPVSASYGMMPLPATGLLRDELHTVNRPLPRGDLAAHRVIALPSGEGLAASRSW